MPNPTIRRFFFLSLWTFSLFLISACGDQQNNSSGIEVKTADLTHDKKFEPNWKSLREYQIPEWFSDAKFGIFIHWGAYSVPEYGSEWYPRLMYMDTATFSAQLNPQGDGPNHVFNHHQKTWGDQKKFGYKDFIPQFKAENFNASDWITLFKKAGAKYVVPVAEHHDGFAMYNSKHTRWNSVKMGPKRDVLGELFAEGRKQGLHMGASTHFAFNWSFFNKKEHFDTVDPQYADLYSKKGTNLRQPISEEFKELWWKRTTNIIDDYKPEVLWLDFYVDLPDFKEYHPKLAAYYYNAGIDWGKKVVLQDKNHGNEAFPEGTIVYDLERGKMAGINKLTWQTDTSIGKNSWGYVSNWQTKDANTLIDDLVDIVSKNGCMLLNVGPKSDGTIPPDQQEILLEIGKWLDVNGQAIYGSRCWRTFGEGPTESEEGYMSERKKQDSFVAEDIRFTTNDGKLYATALDWNSSGKVNIKELAMGGHHCKWKVENVKLLGHNGPLSWTHTDKGLSITLPNKKPCDFAFVFEIDFGNNGKEATKNLL